MMDGALDRLLARYGQTVAVNGAAGRAFLQPVLERREDWKQTLPTPLGTVRQDRFLYLGEAGLPLETGGVVEWRGVTYEVQAAHAVYVGDRLSHWWGVLRLEDGV